MLLVPDRCLNALALREKHRHVLSKASPANCRRNLRWSVGRSRRSGDGQTSGVKILVEDQKLLIAERAENFIQCTVKTLTIERNQLRARSAWLSCRRSRLVNAATAEIVQPPDRSEERRVGKECRSR